MHWHIKWIEPTASQVHIIYNQLFVAFVYVA